MATVQTEHNKAGTKNTAMTTKKTANGKQDKQQKQKSIPTPTAKTPEELSRQFRLDMQWVTENEEKLEKQYGDRTVAIHHQDVVADGANDQEVIRQAEKQKIPSEELLIIDIVPLRSDFSPDFV